MEQEPRIPDVHVIEVKDGFAETVSSPVCDFCFDAGPTWDYECEDFILPEIQSPWGPGCWASTNGWAVCDECAKCIEEIREHGPVAIEASRMLMQRIMFAGKTRLAFAELILRGFFEHSTGKRTPFG